MKRSFLLLFVATLAFTSCKKEVCKTCVTTQTTTVSPEVPGFPQTSSSSAEACGDELEALDGKTTTSSSTPDTYTITVTEHTVCN